MNSLDSQSQRWRLVERSSLTTISTKITKTSQPIDCDEEYFNPPGKFGF
jgi:hypothetical protein